MLDSLLNNQGLIYSESGPPIRHNWVADPTQEENHRLATSTAQAPAVAREPAPAARESTLPAAGGTSSYLPFSVSPRSERAIPPCAASQHQQQHQQHQQHQHQHVSKGYTAPHLLLLYECARTGLCPTAPYLAAQAALASAPGERGTSPVNLDSDDDVPAAAPARGSTPPAAKAPVGVAAAATGAARRPTARRKSLLQPDSTPPGGGETRKEKKCRMDRNRQRIAALEAEAERVENDQRRQLCAAWALFRVYACLSARV
jgi:hypothetical protein